jgi:cobalamin synthase
MADAFSLLFLLQLPLGAVHALASSDNEFAMWMRIFWCATCGTIWWTSVRTLSQAGVHKGWQRALFATVALPLAFVGSNAWAAIWVVLAFGLYEALTTSASVPFAMLVAINAALLAAFFAAARFTRRIVGETDLDGDSSPELERKPTASN